MLSCLPSFWHYIDLNSKIATTKNNSFSRSSRLNCVKAKQNNLRINDHEKEESSPNFETIILNMREEIYDYVRRNKNTIQKNIIKRG